MRWLWLLLLVGCSRVAAENYCCDDPAVCARVVTCGVGTVCDLAGEFGPSNQCVAAEPIDAGPPAGECEVHFDCTGAEGGPACVDGRCQACAEGIGCSVDAPRCTEAHECGGCASNADCRDFAIVPFCAPSGACVECTQSSHCLGVRKFCNTDSYECRGCIADEECPSYSCQFGGVCAPGPPPTQVVVEEGAPLDGPCTTDQPCGSIARAIALADQATEVVVVRPGTYEEDLVVTTLFKLRGAGAVLRGSLVLVGTGALVRAVELRGLRIEGRGKPALRCEKVSLSATGILLQDGDQLGLEVGPGCFATLMESQILDNRGGGAAMSATDGRLTLLSCVVARNGSPESAVGGLLNANPQNTVMNHIFVQSSTVVDNQAAPGVACGIETAPSGVTVVTGSIVYYNPCNAQVTGIDSTASNIEGHPPGTAMDLPPMFVDWPGGDYHLRAYSPCINAVVGSQFSNLYRFDMDHQPRELEPFALIDMGADEYTSPP